MAARAVLDEFTAPAEKAALLERSRGRIESLFGVSLAVLGALGSEEPLPARIWLQLQGEQEAVHSAKVSAAAAPAQGPRPEPRPRDPGRPTPFLQPCPPPGDPGGAVATRGFLSFPVCTAAQAKTPGLRCRGRRGGGRSV